MRRLNDFKIPNFKIPKIKLPKFINVEELTEEIDKVKDVKKSKITYDAPRYNTVKDMFFEVTEKYKDNVCILEKFNHKGKYEEITYEKFKRDVINFSTAIIDFLGLKGERVALISETTYEWYVTYMSLLVSGVIAVPLDKELPSNEIENLIKRSKAKAIVYSPRKKEEILKIKENLNNLEYFIEMYDNSQIETPFLGFDYILNIGSQLVKTGTDIFKDNNIDKDEFKVLIFTSGTTSAAKGVMLCNRNLTENIYGALSYAKLLESDRFFSVLPLHHTYESTIGFLLPLSSGASIAVCEGLKYLVSNIQETKPTIMLAVPILIENLYKKINLNIKKGKKENIVNSMIYITNLLKNVNLDIKRKVFSDIHNVLGGNLRIIVSAAAPIDGKVGKFLEDIGIMFLQGYGLTETAPIAALTPEYNRKVGSAGLPVKCAEAKVNDKGEILIKSTTLMLGYYENEEETNKVIKDGWFNTGDVGYIDEDGYIYITGRSKNVIVTSNGKNIYPEELELLVSKIPYIKDVMVYCDDDDKISAMITLNEEYIKTNFENRPDNSELHDIIWQEIKKINKSLTSYKAIKNLIIKEDDFIKTTTMKIKRFEEMKKMKENK